MAISFNEQVFEQKLVSLKDTQDSISVLSTWCLKNKEHHMKIVNCWLHCLKRVKIDQRLSLFYLANDVIQYSKRKHLDFVNSWGTALQKATPLVRDDKVRNRIMRIFKIWESRGIYDETFIGDLCGLLTTTVKKKVEVASVDPTDFQPYLLKTKLKDCDTLQENTENKYKRVRENKFLMTDYDKMLLSLKDRRHGSDVAAEVDSGVKKMEAFVKSLEHEIGGREGLMVTLQQASVFYERQRHEAKVVANAYRSYGGKLKTCHNFLVELLPTLSSPVPSPDVNAPSPSPDPELDGRSHQPPSNGGDLDFSFVNSSFIGSAQFLDLSRNVFNLTEDEQGHSQDPQAIEVIGGRESKPGLDVAEIMKTLMPNKNLTVQPQSMLNIFDWSANAPWAEPPMDTPQSPPLYEKQVPHVDPIEYDDTVPVPPEEDVDHRALMSMHGNELDQIRLSGGDVDQRVPPPSHTIDHMDQTQPVLHLGLDQPPPILGIDHSHRLPHLNMEPPPSHIGIDQPHMGMDQPPPNLINRDHPPPHLPVHMLEQQSLPPFGLEPPPQLLAMEQLPPNLGMDQPPHHLTMEPPPMPIHLDQLPSMLLDPQPLLGMMQPPHQRMLAPPSPSPRLLSHSPIGSERGAVVTRGPVPDHKPVRNLINLTGSSKDQRCGNYMWQLREMRDDARRRDVNVEAVDMDVSDDDESHTRIVGAQEQQPYQPEPSVEERLDAMHCAGAKLIPPLEPAPPEKNGYNPGFVPAMRWRSPRMHRPPFSHRPNFGFRGGPNMFRPRGRW